MEVSKMEVSKMEVPQIIQQVDRFSVETHWFSLDPEHPSMATLDAPAAAREARTAAPQFSVALLVSSFCSE